MTYFNTPNETIYHESLSRKRLFQCSDSWCCEEAPGKKLGKYHNERMKDRGTAESLIHLDHLEESLKRILYL